MRGYGVYCWLVEVCNSTPTRKIKYQPEDLAWDVHEEAEFVKRIAEEFELFILEDGYLIDAFQRTKEHQERMRQEEMRKRRSEAAKRAAATRKRNKEERERTTHEQESEKSESTSDSETESELANVEKAPEKPASVVPVACNYTYSSVDPMPQIPTTPIKEFADGEFEKRFMRAKELWNEVFAKFPRRQVHALFPSPQIFHYFLQTCSVYTDEDLKLAFKEAARDAKFVWQFKDAIKPDNIQRLLCVQEHKKVVEEESLTDEQKEVLEYIRRNHLDWNEDYEN